MEKNDTQNTSRYRRYYQLIEPVLAKPKTRAYTMAIFSFLAVSLFSWYAIRPTIQTILYLRKEIADKTQVNKQMEEKINALIEAEAAYQAAQPQLPLVDLAIPQTPQAVEEVLQIRNHAFVVGSSLSGIQVPAVPLLEAEATAGAKSQDTKLSTLLVTAVMSAPYSVLTSFLDGIVTMNRIISIEAMTVLPSRETNILRRTASASGTILQLVLKLKTYYQ
jgi:hypothetical protein